MTQTAATDFGRFEIDQLRAANTSLREENARLIAACDALFHSYAVPLEKSDNDKALLRFADAVRPIVYADGKATLIRARRQFEENARLAKRERELKRLLDRSIAMTNDYQVRFETEWGKANRPQFAEHGMPPFILALNHEAQEIRRARAALGEG